MTIQEIISYIDEIKPNAFSDVQKTVWLNEVEGMVQADVMLLAPSSIITYVYSATWSGTIYFPDGATMVCDSAPGFHIGGTAAISGLVTYADNNVTAKILDVSSDGLTLTFAEDTFADIGEAPEAAALTFDGKDTETLVAPPHSKIYYTYLMAMIDFANGEYSKYQNTMTLFNSFFQNFAVWFIETYHPADGEAIELGYYLSAYSIAVNHGYVGTEEEWLASLQGDQAVSTSEAQAAAAAAALSATEAGTSETNASNSAAAAATSATKAEVNYDVDGDRVGFKKGDEAVYTYTDHLTGETGNGIASVSRTSGDGSSGTTDTYTITMTSGETATFTVYNGSDAGITVDDAMSATSTNPVQNKVVQGALDDKSDKTIVDTNNYYGATERDAVLQEIGGHIVAINGSLANKADLVSGVVPASQLPSYVDDVIEAANFSSLPATGESGKIYVTLDTNKTYRWSGSAYAEISESLALGETSSTAYRGDRGETAYDHSQETGNPHGTTAAQITGLIDAIYPIGSIYMSVISTSPATLFGGTWVQLKDRFLLGSGDTYTNGSAGGAATQTLTESNIPTISAIRSKTSDIYFRATSSGYDLSTISSGSSKLLVNGSSGADEQLIFEGSGTAYNNMPPYLAVYMWKRTA